MRALLGLLALVAACSANHCVDKLKWSTQDGRIMVNGQPLVLKGINYFGFETDTHAPRGIWDHDLNGFLDFIKNNNFNAIRVPFALEIVRDNPPAMSVHCHKNEGLCGLSAMRMLDIFIDRAAERGLLIMLDNHRDKSDDNSGGHISPPLWYNNELNYPEDEVIRLWKTLVHRYRNSWNVFAIDLKNEPHDEATWGRSNKYTDWNQGAEKMINALHEFSGLYFVGGIEWGGRFENAEQFPIETGHHHLNNRVVYSPHAYGPDVYDRPEFHVSDADGYSSNLDRVYTKKFGFLAKQGKPVVIGEWGGKAIPGGRDAKWNNWFVNWMRDNCMTNNFYWCLNPNSGHTGGLLEDNWKTAVGHKLDLVNRAQPNPTKFKAQHGKICITKGSFPVAHCQRS